MKIRILAKAVNNPTEFTNQDIVVARNKKNIKTLNEFKDFGLLYNLFKKYTRIKLKKKRSTIYDT